MISPSEANAYVVKFDDNLFPPPLPPLPTDYGCFFSCVSIKHTILNLSVLSFLIFFSNTFVEICPVTR